MSETDVDVSKWLRQLDEAGVAIEELTGQLPALMELGHVLVAVLRRGGRVFACGNGGSALEAQHFAAELIGHFNRDRRPLAALALSLDPGTLTAIANDYSFDDVFSRQIEGLGQSGDALLAFSTSGASRNILAAVAAARAGGLVTLAITGGGRSGLSEACDYALALRSTSTARIQEAHLLAIHLLCEFIDDSFAP